MFFAFILGLILHTLGKEQKLSLHRNTDSSNYSSSTILIHIAPVFSGNSILPLSSQGEKIFSATKLQTTQLNIHGAKLTVEIADTLSSRNQGLMGKDSIPDGYGMLFVYDKPQKIAFWMKNTKIPLSIGFFDAEKRLVQIEDMDPPKSPEATLRTYASSLPVQYALEVPQNWFKLHKIPFGAKFALHDLPR